MEFYSETFRKRMALPQETIASRNWHTQDTSVAKGMKLIAARIRQALDAKKGLLIGRHGTIEFAVICDQYQNLKPIQESQDRLEQNAGVFPQHEIPSWCEAYLDATRSADVMTLGWHEPMALPEQSIAKEINPKIQIVPFRSLEPYQNPSVSWLSSIEGQKVAVVSSFAETMEKQASRLRQIWPSQKGLFPRVKSWNFIRSQQNPTLGDGVCEWPEGIQTWKDAVASLEEKVIQSGAKVCLIGCGGLGMPLGLRLKKHGIVAIVVGGSIQNLFGILGSRWKNHPIISGFFNDAWVPPSADEVPGAAQKVEGGCQW